MDMVPAMKLKELNKGNNLELELKKYYGSRLGTYMIFTFF